MIERAHTVLHRIDSGKSEWLHSTASGITAGLGSLIVSRDRAVVKLAVYALSRTASAEP